MAQYELLTVGNPKTAKGKELGYAVAVLHLAPANLSGHNVCPMATAGCIAGCLNTAGRGGIMRAGETTNAIQKARVRRTQWLYDSRAHFLATLQRDVERFVDWCEDNGFKPVLRLNGTSDLDWDGMAPELMAYFKALGVIRYDYTKVATRMKRQGDHYSLVFSLAENNADNAFRWAMHGGNVAVVFRTANLPKEYCLSVPGLGAVTLPVVDGDKNDLRFLDPRGVIVGLKAKGKAKKDTSGFVRETEDTRLLTHA